MVNKKKNIKYKPKSRNQISNQYYGISHEKLLRKANVKLFEGRFRIITLENGREQIVSDK